MRWWHHGTLRPHRACLHVLPTLSTAPESSAKSRARALSVVSESNWRRVRQLQRFRFDLHGGKVARVVKYCRDAEFFKNFLKGVTEHEAAANNSPKGHVTMERRPQEILQKACRRRRLSRRRRSSAFGASAASRQTRSRERLGARYEEHHHGGGGE